MKKILITGASRGFGFCIAKNFLRTDNKIINIGRTKPDLPLLHIDCDFQSTKSIEEVINKESLLNSGGDLKGIDLVQGSFFTWFKTSGKNAAPPTR